MGSSCKLALRLALLAAAAFAVSAQSPEDSCTNSGGTWSFCASACPLTCENFANPPLFCIQVCVVGCVCPSGTVLNSDGECVATSDCPAPVPSPSPPVPEEQQICESSGGTWSFCASACPLTCDNFDNPPFFCAQVCVVGCVCPSGTVLNDGECVATSDCPAPVPSPSPPVPGEQQICESSGGAWSFCASACPLTCDNFNNPPFFCSQVCVVGCVCPGGTVLNSDGECVATSDCPAPPVSEEQEVCESSGGTWSLCASACPLTCDNFNEPPLFCIQLCVIGCVCPSGMVLNSDGECVATSDCPAPVPSPSPPVPEEQEVCESSGGTWSSCASACPLTCENFNDPPLFCIQVCVVGCVCPGGTVLNSDGECVATTDCPALAPSSPPADIVVDEQICEFSGGTWSACASPCPLTCDSPPFVACPTVCVTGCICPPGTVLDPVYGCKDSSFCEPTFCCLALTSACLACSAGVPESLFCNVNPETVGCKPPAPIGCEAVDCGPGLVCTEVVDPCFNVPCPTTPTCLPVLPPIDLDPCALILCEFGFVCDGGNCVCADIIPGDANTDGIVQINDIVILIDTILNTSDVSECIFDALDLADDDSLTVADVVLLVEIIVG